MLASHQSVAEVFDAIENKTDHIAELLCELIRVPTVVPPGDNYEDFVNLVEPIFQDLGCTTERVIIPEEDIEDVAREIREAIDRGKAQSKAIDVEVEEMRNYPAFKTKLNSPYLKKMAEALKVVHRYKDSDILIVGISGSTDMGYVEQVIDSIDIIGLGALSFDAITAHTADEYVQISALVNMTKQLAYYLTF
ncbi:MAG: M20/M25/M40 family metallo-hydrolase [Promethearchaeota archaeon]